MPATTPSRSWLGNGALTANGLPSHAREQVARAGIWTSFSLSRALFERGPDRLEAYPTRLHRLWSPRLGHYQLIFIWRGWVKTESRFLNPPGVASTWKLPWQKHSRLHHPFAIPTAAFSGSMVMPMGIRRFQPLFVNWS